MNVNNSKTSMNLLVSNQNVMIPLATVYMLGIIVVHGMMGFLEKIVGNLSWRCLKCYSMTK